MTRTEAIDFLVQYAVTIIDARKAVELVRVLGFRSLDDVSIEPRPTGELALEISTFDQQRERTAVAMESQVADLPAVFVADLAAKLALARGMYENIDHAKGSPYSSGQKHLAFVAHRAAIRLAWSFGRAEGVRELRERRAGRMIPRRMFEEKLLFAAGYEGGRIVEKNDA